jgi:Family of unknown function (DUF5946)
MGIIDSELRARCPSCGARLGGRAGCQRVLDELTASAWTDLTRGSLHNLVVDTYAMQHTEEYCRSSKSYAVHLTGLCFAMESDGRPERNWAISRWLDGLVTLKRPEMWTSAAAYHRQRLRSQRAAPVLGTGSGVGDRRVGCTLSAARTGTRMAERGN